MCENISDLKTPSCNNKSFPASGLIAETGMVHDILCSGIQGNKSMQA
jgi:hypothetical protein